MQVPDIPFAKRCSLAAELRAPHGNMTAAELSGVPPHLSGQLALLRCAIQLQQHRPQQAACQLLDLGHSQPRGLVVVLPEAASLVTRRRHHLVRRLAQLGGLQDAHELRQRRLPLCLRGDAAGVDAQEAERRGRGCAAAGSRGGIGLLRRQAGHGQVARLQQRARREPGVWHEADAALRDHRHEGSVELHADRGQLRPAPHARKLGRGQVGEVVAAAAAVGPSGRALWRQAGVERRQADAQDAVVVRGRELVGVRAAGVAGGEEPEVLVDAVALAQHLALSVLVHVEAGVVLQQAVEPLHHLGRGAVDIVQQHLARAAAEPTAAASAGMASRSAEGAYACGSWSAAHAMWMRATCNGH